LSRNELVSVAKIIKPQGNKGEVAAELLTDFPQRFHHLQEVYLQKNGRSPFPVVLEAFRLHKQRIILKFSGIDDIGAAEGLRGHEVRIGREKLLVLPRGSYYQFDLIDCVARDSKGRRLGQVTEVLEFGGQFLLKVRRGGGKELLVPFVKDIVRSVDVSKKELICELPQGLEEL
jgi:16S rRNA processing protein RimM